MNLQNSWMNSVDFLAAMAHALFGCLLAVTLAFFTGGYLASLIGAGALVLASGVKEFWYDANYELPPQTAADNWTDFAFYQVGSAVGLGLIFLHLHFS
jgi:hypothetical protein